MIVVHNLLLVQGTVPLTLLFYSPAPLPFSFLPAGICVSFAFSLFRAAPKRSTSPCDFVSAEFVVTCEAAAVGIGTGAAVVDEEAAPETALAAATPAPSEVGLLK